MKIAYMTGKFIIAIQFVLFSASIAIAGIAATKHNLSMSGPGVVKSGVEDRICVFCHTPHSATVSIDGLHVPLWNHTLSNAVYTLLASPTLKSVPQNPPDGDSRLCLSCHDGTVAIGSVARSGYSPSLINVEGTGAGGVMPGLAGEPGSSNLGTDLSGHHPVSLEVNTALINAKNTQCNDPVSPISWRVCFPLAGNPVKMRPTNNLYGAGAHTNTGVQCSSCHDPHEDTPPGNKFLRVDISDPAFGIDPLCLACHRDCDLACP